SKHFWDVAGLKSTKCVRSEIKLSQDDALSRKSGESVKLSCEVSGFSLSEYWTCWIRQKSGTTLEWIGEINGAGSTINYTPSFKGRFTISKENSKNMLYLKINSMQAEDTANYYCAKYTRQRKS
uniref:Immunoglobulin heavy variable 13-2 n=1 Tax=Erpetoichthys calabaricus TaxID=27687 RepID=A0A8C4REH0_ERPCA